MSAGAGHPRRRVAAALLGVAAAAFAAGHVVGRLSDSSANAVGPASSHRAVTVQPLGGTAEEVLARSQEVGDRPIAPVGVGLRPTSFRVLTAIDGSGVLLYGTEDRSGGTCLVAVADDGRLTASCVPKATFRRRPIQLDLTVARPPDRRGRTDPRVEIVARWQASGPVTWRYVSG